LAEQRLAHKSKPVIWLKVEQASAETILEALADCCGDKKAYDSARGDNKRLVLRSMLEKLKACLLVLDDVENIPALEDVLQATPKNLPVLVTSRQSFDLDEIVNVDQLEPSDALDLLGFSAGGKDFRHDPNASQLCADFEYLPYALELCGQEMKVQGRNPKEQRQKLADNLLSLSRPGNKEDNLIALLSDWAENLEDQTKTAFLAFGAFPENGLTSTLIGVYTNISLDILNSSLDDLVSYSLVKRQPETQFYYMHKLTFEYVHSLRRKSKTGDRKLANSAVRYLSGHSQEFDFVALDLNNLLAIAGRCNPSELVEIMSWLAFGGYPAPGADSYFENKGHSLAFLERLDQAIIYCRKGGRSKNSSLHYLLGKRGNAFFNLADYERAVSCYEEAMTLAPNQNRQAVLMSVAARTYAIAGNDKKARKYFKASYKLAEKLQNDLLLASVMGQDSYAASATGNYKKIKAIASKQVAIARNLVDKTPSPQAYKQLFFSLLNLGTAEMDLSKQQRDGSFQAALPILQEVYGIAVSQKSDVFLAHALNTLGENYHYLNKKMDARTCFEQSLKLWRKLGVLKYAKELETLMKSLHYRVPS
jgi:tetratricopeptide (TPR) repeat protein